MSRLSHAPNRNLSLTEELERLEQSITLTLQEIDHNFSKAHRIVTSSILPVVEQYAKHSQDAWEGTKFWKQFFEASANVSLSGYEEAALEEDTTHTNTETSQDASFQTTSTHDEEDDMTITGVDHDDANDEDDQGQYDMNEDETSIIDSPTNATGVHSTPRIAQSSTTKGNTRNISPSPSNYHPTPMRTLHSPDDQISTPIRGQLDLNSSSPFNPPSAFQPPTAQRQNPDPIMHHRILDRNFRIQATPLTTKKKQPRSAADAISDTPGTNTQRTQTRTLFPDSSPMSSPEMAAPQLRSDLFSPEKARLRATPRTPGVSVQTPNKDMTISTGRALFTDRDNTRDGQTTRRTLWESDSDDDDDGLGISPPKTMQFHIPQSRLMQTPAREASKMIIDDLLATAGADRTDEIEDDDVPEISPSVVRRKWEDDDTF